MNKGYLLVIGALVTGLSFLISAGQAFAVDPGCTSLGGAEVGGTCEVSVVSTPAAAVVLNEPLHLKNGAHVHLTNALSLTVNAGGLALEMDKGSSIEGHGKSISINVPTGNMVMHGTGAPANTPTDKCYANGTAPNNPPSNALGAQITSVQATVATTVTINVGDILANPPTGSFEMERCSVVSVNSAHSAGAVSILVGHDVDIDGIVMSEGGESGQSPHQPPGGGPIRIRTSCELAISKTGVVSSKGRDPGADLVHLEGCDVTIDGLVQSAGAGHVVPDQPANHCDVQAHNVNKTDTGCIEVWAEELTISSTGEVNADVNLTGSGGPQGTSYIDLFAEKEIKVTGKTGASDIFAVHADSKSGTDITPNTVTVLSHTSTVTASGRAFSASSTGNGSFGGKVDIEASKKVNLDTAIVRAAGDFAGGSAPCSSGSGACGQGGQIIVRSWTDAVSWASGEGDARPDSGAAPPAGSISLTACTTITVGANFHSTTPSQTITPAVCPAGPDLPAYVEAAFSGPNGDRVIWTRCGQVSFEASKRGMKFNDANNNGAKDVGEAGIANWPINLLTTANAPVQTTNTLADGSYSFSILAAGTYRVCEGSGPAGYVQTYPHGAPNATPNPPGETIISTCPAPNIWGYQFVVANGTNLSGNDFGNFKPESCQKPTAITIMNETYPGNKGPDITVRTWAPLNESVQTAVDTVTDTNSDGFLIIMVIAHADLSLGGTANQKVVVSKKDYALPFGLFGCSVTLTGGGAGPAVSITADAWSQEINVNGKPTTIFLADLHGGNSQVGVQANGTKRYLRNEAPKDNKGAGISVIGNSNTVHNGTSGDKGHGNGGDGVYVIGNNNYLTDTNAFANGGNGFNVQGDNNQLVKLDSGDKGKGNKGDGIHVVGSSNSISEPSAFANSGDGVDVAGNNNTVTKADAGEKTKLASGGTGNGQNGVRIAGTGNNVDQSAANSNGVAGFDISGGTAGSPNVLASNQSNSHGNSDYENTGPEYVIAGSVTNGGSNKADDVAIPVAAKCPSFPAAGSCE